MVYLSMLCIILSSAYEATDIQSAVDYIQDKPKSLKKEKALSRAKTESSDSNLSIEQINENLLADQLERLRKEQSGGTSNNYKPTENQGTQ